MKTLKLFMAVILVTFAGMAATAQTTGKNGKNKTETIKVSGNCSMCRDRIEKAAKADGVEKASWDSKTGLLTLSYDPSKTNTDALAKKVASAGHDAGRHKAEDKVYNALPGCCKYNRSGSAGAADHSGHKH